jgi:hypothetical protein
MERRGPNQFVLGQKVDKLKTINRDIVMEVDPPIPVSSRLYGLPKNVVIQIEKLIRVKWSIIADILSWSPVPVPYGALIQCSLVLVYMSS